MTSTGNSLKPSGGGDSTAQTYDHLFKIVLIGDAGVGKSSILLRFTDDRYDEDHLSTIGVDLKVKFVDIGTGTNKKRIKVTIWDTAGQERFRTLTASYFHKVQGLILCYDVTKRETFDNLSMWNNEIDVNTDGAPVVRVLVGNKIDQAEHRQVSRREGEQWAQEHSMLFLECSAKTRVGIQQVFNECIMKILDNSVLVQTSTGGGATVLQASKGGPGGKSAQEDEQASSSCCG
jgi:Ras-related protein Rab-18